MGNRNAKEGQSKTDADNEEGSAPSKGASQDVKQRKIVVLDCGKVGKTALTTQFTEDKFTHEYCPTVDQTLYKTLRFRGEDYHLTILDTAGQDDTSLFQPRYTIATDGYILVFAIDDPVSFDIAKLVYDRIHEFVVKAVVLLVGNKTDLEKERQISIDQATRLAEEWHCGYIECSAKRKDNVAKVFTTMLEQVLNREDGLTQTKGTATSSATESTGGYFRGLFGKS